MANYKYITNPAAPSKYRLTATGSKAGAQVVMSSDNDPTNQTWDVTPDGYLVNKSSGLVIETTTVKAGNILTLATKNGGSNQKWTYNAYYRIVSQQDNYLCIWAKGGIFWPGANAAVETVKEGEATQRWWLLSPT